ncbi:RHS repeat-associated core domain-containing protein [Tatumella sp. OPLPL6]|uniref:RHS repeat-associated core domain-containing protein n=1 Tax=Tatumella sp. OPLPL6 TaxID=1928657 RepID=UPI000C182FEA|nr:RHS repeat-associated core domain-containing protein [Tatumella sp. OPLPL6]PIJ45284.1 hypothetical protein BOM24_03730 [Tatumella sp. OPLPL6]
MTELLAARQGDPLVHSSVLADFIGGVVEGAVVAAAFVAGEALMATGVGLPFGAALIAGALATDIPDKIGGFVSEGVDSLINALGLQGPPDGKILTGSSNVLIMGKPAARAAGTVERQWLKIPDNELPPPPGFFHIFSVQAVAIGQAIAHPGAAINSMVESLGHISWASVGNFFSDIGKDMIQPTVVSADPHSTPAAMDTIVCTKSHIITGIPVIAEGSKRVLINDHPAARNGDRSSCEATIQVNENSRVRIGGGTVVVQDIRSGKNFLANLVGQIQGVRAIAKLVDTVFARALSRALKAGPSKLIRDVRKSFKEKKALEDGSIVGCILHSGHPVHYASGAKFLFGEEDLDFIIEDRIPLLWQRHYNSRNTQSGIFGLGWSTEFETRLRQVQHPDGHRSFLLRDRCGEEFDLGEVNAGDAIHFHEDKLSLYCTLQGVLILAEEEQRYYTFEVDPLNSGEWRVQRIYDRHENCHYLTWGADGKLTRISNDNEALDIQLTYDAEGRQLQAIYQVTETGHHCLSEYRYNAQGQLAAVRDADKIVTRQFAYHAEHHLLTSHTVVSGVRVDYQWQRAECEADQWRVVEYQVWDEQNQLQESWVLDADEAARTIMVTRLGGPTTVHQWDALGRMTHFTESDGSEWQFEWRGSSTQLAAAYGPEQRTWRYEYDERGNLTKVLNPLGQLTQRVWHPIYPFPLTIVDQHDAVWQFRYNLLGDLISQQDPLGSETHYEWNWQGDLVVATDALGNTQRYEWNALGQPTKVEDCSGYQHTYQYDERGRLIRDTTAEGQQTQYQLSAAGRLQQVTRADGRLTEYHYDDRGLLTEEIIDQFSRHRLQRDARGLVTRYTDPVGLNVDYRYDRLGRLTALINQNQRPWQFEYNNDDQLIAQTDYAGQRSEYRYTSRGQVREQIRYPRPGGREAPQVVQYQYDLLDRLTIKTTGAYRTEYHYRSQQVELRKIPLDHWQECQRSGVPVSEQEVVTLSYDKLGQLLREEDDRQLSTFQYDALGHLSQQQQHQAGRTFTLKTLRYGSGHVVSLHNGQQEIVGYRRDKRHREIERSQGELTQYTEYDTVGRITLRRSADSARGPASLERRIDWVPSDDIIQQRLIGEQGNHREQGYHYDVHHQITTVQGQGPSTRYHYDPAGNPIESAGEHLWDNLLKRLGGARWEYDGFGRLLWRKANHHAAIQHFSYDDEQRVSAITFEGHSEFTSITFHYDLFGRRREKRVYRHGQDTPEIIEFFWTGAKMTGECSSARPGEMTQYHYSEDSWEPIARTDSTEYGEKTYWYHCGLNGLPTEMTNASGKVVWRGEENLWGEISHEISHFSANAVQQNLRFQGQYLDRETGLHYNLFRYYDPVARRFTQPDPIGLRGGINTYQYAPNALAWVDPLGLKACGTTKFYRSMSHEDYEHLLKTGELRGTSETFISPRRAFSEGYEGVLVKFHLKKDSLQELKAIGVKDSASLTKLTYPDMPGVSKSWKYNNAFFKSEGDQINIGLGKGKALDLFNKGIHKFVRLN